MCSKVGAASLTRRISKLMLMFILQEEVMTLERILLQTIKFDLQVEHPYGFLLKYAKSLKGNLV